MTWKSSQSLVNFAAAGCCAYLQKRCMQSTGGASQTLREKKFPIAGGSFCLVTFLLNMIRFTYNTTRVKIIMKKAHEETLRVHLFIENISTVVLPPRILQCLLHVSNSESSTSLTVHPPRL